MEEKAKDIWGKVKGAAGGLSTTVKAIIVAAIVIVLVAVAFLLANNSKKDYEALFTDLNSDDLTSITKYLNDSGMTDYMIQGENTIMVPADQEVQLKAQLIAEGYPKSGLDYGLYLTSISSLSTESDRAQIALYELNNRLAATIRCFEGVQDAVVNIAMGEDRRYVLSQDNTINASASVVVTMKEGEQLNSRLAEAIRATVSHSVKGLIIDEVDIRDSEGNTFNSDGTADGWGELKSVADTKLALEEQWNKKLRNQVMDVLVPMYGEGNVSVSVNTTVNMDTSRTESTEYTQPDWAGAETNGEGILKKKVFEGRIIAGEDGIGGVVGTEPNADLNEYVERYQPDGEEGGLEYSGEKEFENNKTITQSERIGGYLDDVTVAVSINSRVPNTANQDALINHVGKAVGLLSAADQADRISIISHEFYVPESDIPANTEPMPSIFADIPMWVYLALLAGLFLFMVLCTVIILLTRSRGRRRVQQLEPALADGPAEDLEELVPAEEPEPAGADIMDVHTEKSMELRRSVRELAESNPEIAAQAIKALLRGDEEGNVG